MLRSHLKMYRNYKILYNTVIKQKYSSFYDEYSRFVDRKYKSDSHDIKEFAAIYPRFKKDVIDKVGKIDKNVAKITEEYMDHNVTGGKWLKPSILFETSRIIEKSEKSVFLNTENMYLLGWCIELVSTSILGTDDIVDGSDYRRGNISWHKLPSVGLRSILDNAMIQALANNMLDLYFRDEVYFQDIARMFNNIPLLVYIGQIADCNSFVKNNATRWSNFTEDYYRNVATYKLATSAFNLPVYLAMTLSGRYSEKRIEIIHNPIKEIGIFWQVRNDYLDCYEEPKNMGKLCTDIDAGALSWLTVKALEIADDRQKEIIKKNYGTQDARHIIKEIYDDLKLEDEFNTYKDNTVKSILEEVEDIDDVDLRDIVLNLVKKFCV